MPDLPLIICGDFNMGAAEARQRIADPIGGHLYSAGSVDHIIFPTVKTSDSTVSPSPNWASWGRIIRRYAAISVLNNWAPQAGWRTGICFRG
jgi:hypothetical protein